MYYLIVDLEMGEVDAKDRDRLGGMAKEIIQLGAVLIGPELTAEGEFSSYSRPQIGYVSHYIKKMTGITNDRLKDAPSIDSVLHAMAEWLGDREITALSWSDADCRQLRQEMRVKNIRIPAIEALFDTWVDFQLDFGRLGGFAERCSLADALWICHVKPSGQEHDGLCDARNTARLFIRVMRQKELSLTLTPIRGRKLSVAKCTEKVLWTPDRFFYALRYGKAEALSDGYRKHALEKRLRKR